MEVPREHRLLVKNQLALLRAPEAIRFSLVQDDRFGLVSQERLGMPDALLLPRHNLCGSRGWWGVGMGHDTFNASILEIIDTADCGVCLEHGRLGP